MSMNNLLPWICLAFICGSGVADAHSSLKLENSRTARVLTEIKTAGVRLAIANAGSLVSTAGDPIKHVFSPDDYGAKGDNLADDGLAIRAASDALQAAGSGTLLFTPGRTYKVYSVGTDYAALGTFSHLTGVSIIGRGATVSLDPDRHFTTSYGTMFGFAGCTDICIDGMNVVGPLLDISPTPVSGVEFVRFSQGCSNINMPLNRVQGVIAGVIIARSPTDPDSYATHNVHIGVLDVQDCFYGINCQRSGNDLTIDALNTDTIHRSYFVYGVKNHRVTIHSKDPFAYDALINAYGGEGVENLDLSYYSGTDTIHSDDSAARVVIRWGDPVPATFSNLRIRLDVHYADAGQTGAEALKIEKMDASGTNYDLLDRGHVLQNLHVSGTITGTPHYKPAGLINVSSLCHWGNGDTWRNILFENLTIASTLYNTLHMQPIKDALTLINVQADGSIMLMEDALGTAQVSCIGCNFANLYHSDARSNAEPVLNIRTGGNTTVPVGWRGRSINNSMQTTDAYYYLPAADPGLEFTFLQVNPFAIMIKPHGQDNIMGYDPGNQLITRKAGTSVTLRCVIPGSWQVCSIQGVVAAE